MKPRAVVGVGVKDEVLVLGGLVLLEPLLLGTHGRFSILWSKLYLRLVDVTGAQVS